MEFPSMLDRVREADQAYFAMRDAPVNAAVKRETLARLLQERQANEQTQKLMGLLTPEQQLAVKSGAKLSDILDIGGERGRAEMLRATVPFIMSESRPEDARQHLLSAQAQLGTPVEQKEALKSLTEVPKDGKTETRKLALTGDMLVDQEKIDGRWVNVGEPYSRFAKQVATPTNINTSNVQTMARTEGQKAIDRQFGKDYVAWKATGGISSFDADMQRLQESLDALESGRNISGPLIGATPDVIKSFVKPEAKQVRDDVGAVIQKSLRAILGGQFAQKEGEALLKRTYDESLSEAQNAHRVKILMKQLQEAAEAKEAAAEYFEKYGTLTGYTGKDPRTIISENRNISNNTADDFLRKRGLK